ASSPTGSPPSPPSRGLSALAAIIEELASNQPLEESVARSLDSLRLTLAVRAARDLDEEESLLVTAVANLLGPELAHAEKNRQLEVEVEARTAEINRERIFTEKIIDSLPLGLYVIDRE